MTTRLSACRRRLARTAQRGSAVRGAVVAAGLVAGVVLQLAGPRLQCRLAELVGVPGVAPAKTPAATSMPSCGSPAADNSMRPCKVATMASADTGVATHY